MSHPRLDWFLAQWPRIVTPDRAAPASTLPVLRWLPHPEGPDADPRHRLVRRLHHLHARLTWSQTYRAEDFGADFLDRYGWTELIGARGPVASETLACGFLLLGPEVEYPDHYHVAEELYIALSGTALWRCGPGAWRAQPPGAILHHPPNMPHAMRTSREPLLALYLWCGGDLTQKSIIA
jgi:mannose-6-phosphate isomerase-like protein (cupin superfamily)